MSRPKTHYVIGVSKPICGSKGVQQVTTDLRSVTCKRCIDKDKKPVIQLNK